MWVERVFKENVHPMDNNIDVLIILLYTTTQPSKQNEKRGVDSSSSGAAQEPSVLR